MRWLQDPGERDEAVQDGAGSPRCCRPEQCRGIARLLPPLPHSRACVGRAGTQKIHSPSPSAARHEVSGDSTKPEMKELSEDKVDLFFPQCFYFSSKEMRLDEKAYEIPFPCNPAEFHRAGAENIPTIFQLARK